VAVELDHVFVWVSAGAPEADRLVAVGLTEGPPNRHPGQGTANRRFFFANAMLELLWVDDAVEAQGEAVRPLRLSERWSRRSSGASPFGVILRPAGQATVGPPFPAWEYRPPYFPESLSLHAGRNAATVAEPLLFYVPRHPRPDAIVGPHRHLLEHRAGWRELTAVRIFSPQAASPSAEMQAALQTGAFTYAHGDEHLLEIGFDGEKHGLGSDLRPDLPLVICW
jgi:Glyoxalase-like domain